MSVDAETAVPGAVLAEYDTGPITREMLALYAEASGDLNPLHLDPAFARKAGFDDVIVHGMLGMALLGRLLTAHFPAQTPRRFEARFVAVLTVQQSLHCTARLAGRTAAVMRLDLAACDGSGKTIISGSAELTLAG